MSTIIQYENNYPISYPFESSVTPLFERLRIKDIPQNLMGVNMIEFLYPHIRADNIAYMAGVTKDKWDEFYKSIYIMSCEFSLRNIVIMMSSEIYVVVQIQNLNWRQYYPVPQDFRNILTYQYNIGFSVGLVGNSVRKTLEMNQYPAPYQMYFNASSQSKSVPHFDYQVIPAFDITKDKYIFGHAANSLNLARIDDIAYIKKVLCYATANGMKGVVFHCGSSVNDPVDKCLGILANNIVSGIRAAMFSQNQTKTAKFILETPAGKGNEVLTDINQFIWFCNLIKTNYPDIAPFFSICVDTCHVHQCGYAPHIYLEEINKIHPVEFVHFNDSLNGWCCRKDNHAKPGEGHIPWPYLLSVAQFCKVNSIPAVFEN